MSSGEKPADKVVASLSCSQCACPTFFVLQVENDFNLLCRRCGYLVTIQDSVDQLRKAKLEGGL